MNNIEFIVILKNEDTYVHFCFIKAHTAVRLNVGNTVLMHRYTPQGPHTYGHEHVTRIQPLTEVHQRFRTLCNYMKHFQPRNDVATIPKRGTLGSSTSQLGQLFAIFLGVLIFVFLQLTVTQLSRKLDGETVNGMRDRYTTNFDLIWL